MKIKNNLDHTPACNQNLVLHVTKDERPRTDTLTRSNLKLVRFKRKLGTLGMLLRCLNGDRSREKMSYSREKEEFSREKKEKMKDQIFGKRVHAEESGTEVSETIIFFPRPNDRPLSCRHLPSTI
ncbi:hypothetical protein LR48_Vigan10g083600 [Vigna angularis]|uniref:Uncharacterized protein n=1 Tax=Phaseolus angularis TaxID=3914 RepID=A0A0L9VJS3_PHAAN|nr:hypothetical protein LR48_Vigan10g083600 [Vigna angularis]